jgi:glycosyltransferase involved in cell wall biosynthesis
MRRVRVLGEPLLPGLASRISPARYDAVIGGLVGRINLPLAYLTARARGIPFILWTGTWHHPQTTFHRLTKGAVEHLYRRADAIVVYGEHVRRVLTSLQGVVADKIFAAPQAVEQEQFNVRSDPAASRDILFVGQFQEWKGIRDLRDAFASITDPSLTLSLAGHGPLEPELVQWAEADPRIRILGHISQERVPELLAGARALVLPSTTTNAHRETWGLVVNEAMHAGLPVVATDAVGAAAHGLVEDMKTGLVVPERDPDALAQALSKLARSDALVSRLGHAARERAAGYTFSAMADGFEAAVTYARAAHG